MTKTTETVSGVIASAKTVYVTAEAVAEAARTEPSQRAQDDRVSVIAELSENLRDIGAGNVSVMLVSARETMFALNPQDVVISLTRLHQDEGATSRVRVSCAVLALPAHARYPAEAIWQTRDRLHVSTFRNRRELEQCVRAAMHEHRVLQFIAAAIAATTNNHTNNED